MSHRSLTRIAAALVRDIDETRKLVAAALADRPDDPKLIDLYTRLAAMRDSGKLMLREHGKA